MIHLPVWIRAEFFEKALPLGYYSIEFKPLAQVNAGSFSVSPASQSVNYRGSIVGGYQLIPIAQDFTGGPEVMGQDRRAERIGLCENESKGFGMNILWVENTQGLTNMCEKLSLR